MILLESIESFKFVSYRAIISEEFDSRKDSQPTKFKKKNWILINLRFRESCDSKLSGLNTFDNTTISLNRKKKEKWERSIASYWDTDPWSDFCDLHWELVCCNNWNAKGLEISTPVKIVVTTHFHAQHDTDWNKPENFTCWCNLPSKL